MKLVDPIGFSQQKAVVDATNAYIEQARSIFKTDFGNIAVRFDLTGKAAGMYRVQGGESVIRYNAHLFAKYFDDNLTVTIPHEVAHYITDRIYGLRKIRPHGKEWKALMAEFGADNSRTCNYNLEGIPRRSYRRFPYRCGCTDHELTSRRHKQIQQGKMQYFCRQCGSSLTPQEPVK